MIKILTRLIAIPCLVLLYPVNSYAASAAYNLQLTAAQEDYGQNLKDHYYKFTASMRSIAGITRNSAFNLNADLYTRSYADFKQWDSDGLLLEAIYSYVPTAGFSKPTYLFGLRFEYENFDQNSRDFQRNSIFVATSLRLDDRTTLTPGLQYSAKSTDDEDDNISALFLNSDFQFSQSWLIYLNLKYESEKITTSASALSTSGRPQDIAAHHTPAESGVVNTSLPSATSGSFLHTDSDNVILTLGANYSIDSHQTIDVSYQRQNYGVSGVQDITGTVVSLDYFYKF
jgi:hypothetical protein